MADQEQGQGNIRQEYNNATTGLNMDQIPSQIPKGKVSYALNAAVENFDSNSVSYQNEPGNEVCVSFPEGYVLIGHHLISELDRFIFFITHPQTGGSQIGYMEHNDCVYHVLVNAPCLNFNVHHPIYKCIHKTTNCTTEIYWTDGYNPRRYLDIFDIPKILKSGSPLCSPIYTDDLDCNQLKVQPDFSIPQLEVVDVTNTGSLISGTYQFAVQYSDAIANPFTSYFSITNPTPIADTSVVTVNFNYPVGKSIILDVSNLDITGQFQWFNIAVIKTINAISSVELVGTYFIDNSFKQVTYTGAIVDSIRLSIADIFEKFPYYDIAQDVTTAQDILIWDGLSSIDRMNLQKIANQITLQWESWRLPAAENYSNELNATNFRSYLRDEVYALEFVPLLSNGKQLDGFHIPGREKNYNENLPDVDESNDDFIGTPDYYQGGIGHSAYWKIYNTASVTETIPPISTNPKVLAAYKGPYQRGEFAYWESTEEYPCDENVWGTLAGQKIRHHKFPDVAISPIFESKIFTGPTTMVMGSEAVFPIGIKIDIDQIQSLINSSSLTDAQKADIVGFKIVRGDRGTNKSIVAKGILRNVNEYTRDDETYYFPNYPYNDLHADAFINSTNNAYADECNSFSVNVTTLHFDPAGGPDYAELSYVDCNTAKTKKQKYFELGAQDDVCSIGKPSFVFGKGTTTYKDYDTYELGGLQSSGCLTGWRAEYVDITEGIIQTWVSIYDALKRNVVVGTTPVCVENCEDSGLCVNRVGIIFFGRHLSGTSCVNPTSLPPITDRYRQIFNSPETSFGQPFLGDVLKLESVIYGAGKAHFTEVKKNAKYKLLTKEAQKAALDSSAALGAVTSDFDATAMFTAYQAYLAIYINGITRKNYAYSFNSIASYDYSDGVPDDEGVKQRTIDIARYLIPSVVSVGDTYDINNYQRETSVFIKTDDSKNPLPFPDKSPEMVKGVISKVTDYSRFTISDVGNCGTPAQDVPIRVVSYYASLKNIIVNQWGQMYSYDTIDTGFQQMFATAPSTATVFGGDTFIGRFAFKTKVPFFIDNRVGAPDDSDIFYDEIGNIGYPKYWHSARSILSDYTPPAGLTDSPGVMVNLISYKAHNFDCPNDEAQIIYSSPGITTTTTTSYVPVDRDAIIKNYDGYFYLFAYGVPNFYCESSYNTDVRQAFNNREGDFWPHVTTSIPDDWVQESFVSIANDNTYYYNVTYSKQNKENKFTHLPFDWKDKMCYTQYPFRAIYSEVQNADVDNKINSWLVYRPVAYYDFPQNFGALTSLDGIQNRAILARFENKTLMYDKLLTIDTSNPQAAYIGNSMLFKGGPPIDFAETDLGYVGCQNKMLLKIPNGQVSVDAKRGQVFLISGTEAIDLSGFGSGLNRFFTDHLAFEILRYFPDVDTDNHFHGVGLHGVYDSKYDRVIITKMDYVPVDDSVKYDPVTQEFYVEKILTMPDTTTTTTTAPTTTTTTTIIIR